MTTTRTSDHPAPFSPEIIQAFALLLVEGHVDHIHDCYAGDGRRLGDLADTLGLGFSGTELAGEFIRDIRVRPGDATDPSTYPADGRWAIVTSPVYPNGIADHFTASPERCKPCGGTGFTPSCGCTAIGDSNTSSCTHDQPPCPTCEGEGTRPRHDRTYRSWLARIRGYDEPLPANNMGRWGYRNTPLTSEKRWHYWRLARRSVACWSNATAVYLNVSDFLVGDHTREPVVRGWAQLLAAQGWRIVDDVPVKTRRWRDGANSTRRVESEHILVAHPAE